MAVAGEAVDFAKDVADGAVGYILDLTPSTIECSDWESITYNLSDCDDSKTAAETYIEEARAAYEAYLASQGSGDTDLLAEYS